MKLKQLYRNNSEVSRQRFGLPGMSCFEIFRLMFVLSNFFVLGDVLYRWDGFVYYYASFGKFIPTLALVLILWSSIAVLTSIMLWLSGRAFVWFSLRVGLKGKIEHFLLFVGVFAFFGVTAWIVRSQVVSRGTTFTEKLIVFLCVSLIAIFLPWVWRNKVERCFKIILQRIVPIVKLFGILIMISVLIVVYFTW